MLPFDIAPQIEQHQGQSDKKQAQRHTFGSGARPQGIHQSIAGFDAKASAIFLKELLGREFQFADEDIGEVFHPVATIAPLVVFADDMNREGAFAILLAGTGIGGLVTLASLQQGPRATLFAPDGQGNDGGKGLATEIFHHRIVIKASIQKQPLHPQPQRFRPIQQAFERRNRVIATV